MYFRPASKAAVTASLTGKARDLASLIGHHNHTFAVVNRIGRITDFSLLLMAITVIFNRDGLHIALFAHNVFNGQEILSGQPPVCDDDNSYHPRPTPVSPLIPSSTAEFPRRSSSR